MEITVSVHRLETGVFMVISYRVLIVQYGDYNKCAQTRNRSFYGNFLQGPDSAIWRLQ